MRLNNNALIKKNRLAEEIHKKGMRMNKKTLGHLSGLLQEGITRTIEVLARDSMIKGKKTMSIEDIDSVFEKLKEKEETWEI
jgi:hypothetical protein